MTASNETRWTPGPWTIYEARGNRTVTIRAEHTSIASVSANLHRRANAHLIAAAPELYEALADTIGILEDAGATATLQIVRTALAKARGDTP